MTPEVAAVFQELHEDFPGRGDYTNYWGSVAPKDDTDYFRRWLFAFCSVHTTWKSNVNAYNAIKGFEVWRDDREELHRLLICSRAGMHNNRTRYIWDFKNDFWADPSQYYRQEAEPWAVLRNRLEARVTGLGLAKTTFALEMAFPLDARLTCLDVHMLRLYGCERKNGKQSQQHYEAIEADWVGRSANLGASPYVVRCAYWDKRHGHKDSRYWSHCLETGVSS